jgi:hypothetical protein
MKKIFFSLLFIPLLSIGQNQEIIELQNEIDLIKENLDSHHKNYVTGTVVSLAGLSATIIGTVIALPELIIIGGVTSLVGTGITIDSDKWFGKRFMGKKLTITKPLTSSKNKIKELKTSIHLNDNIEVKTSFKTYTGTFVSHGSDRFEIKTLKGKSKIFFYKEIISLNKID